MGTSDGQAQAKNFPRVTAIIFCLCFGLVGVIGSLSGSGNDLGRLISGIGGVVLLVVAITLTVKRIRPQPR